MTEISPRAAAVLLRHLPARRLRVAYRADAEVHRVLIALEVLALDRDGATGIAIGAARQDTELVTINEFARARRIKPDTVRRAVRAGQIPGAVKRDGRWHIPAGTAWRPRRRCYCPGKTYCDC
jgi:hypothetical protein